MKNVDASTSASTSASASAIQKLASEFANTGDASAMQVIASEFFKNKRFENAIELYSKSSGIGVADASFMLGNLYERGGKIVDKNYNKAAKFYSFFLKQSIASSDINITNAARKSLKIELEKLNPFENPIEVNAIANYATLVNFENLFTSEFTNKKVLIKLDRWIAEGKITDPKILEQLRAITAKPAPKAEWVQAPQTTSEEEVTFKFNVVDGGGGIGDVSFKLNGVALNVAQGRNASVIELANTNVRTFTFRLPPGKHDVEVIAYNAENLINWTSLKSTVTSTFKPIRKPQLHAVIVGINDYENDKLKLRFATNDATEVAKVLKASGEKLYDQVHVKLLNTRGSTGKTAILQAIKEAASKAQTEDVFIFYVAGHGQNFGDNGYHMLTADVGVMTDKAIQERSISAQELQLAISNVPSGKKVVLLDTCQSGGGLDASKLMSVRGGIDNLDMVKDMNRKSGAIVLAAAESKEDAMEGYQGHGVFTFALLEALKGKADTKGDGFVSTFQLQEYVSNRTYELAQLAFNGKKQSPYTSGNNGFPFLKWK
jgi:Caspase domain